ncbi:HD domain-containing phosphohydrolase [Magnetofaba australis]|uniref:Putative two-component system response regulator (Hybrid family) protein n=1 Tax=Magnetofaba australis IT-1 TaxID=1434232 RepID=A0A1Y2K507_9PROT|nr:HD domain-containing phosphohydrolase [Magnetofaba australis]OSM02204.1 putative two-component system response regulator (hybrid family) protein [Magnetofaba australis IT-1]
MSAEMTPNSEQNSRRRTVLAVDDTPENLHVFKELLSADYRVQVATNGVTALKISATQRPDLILLDIMMPGMDGYEVCRHLKSDPHTASIPVIFVTAMSDVMDEHRGLEAGAVDYVTKPVQPALLEARVRTHMALADQQRACEALVRQRTQELEVSYRAAIDMLGEAGHYNDTDTGAHIWRMASYSRALAQAAGMSVEEAKLLELAAPMHDMGKIGIGDEILKAPRKLTAEEFEVIKTHTLIGARILSKSDAPLFKLAASVALHHHERWDGAGYPDKLAGEAIPLEARIVAIADVFDALTMKRPYKEPWPIDKAMDAIREGSGLHFDPELARLFCDLTEEVTQIKQEWDREELQNSERFSLGKGAVKS